LTLNKTEAETPSVCMLSTNLPVGLSFLTLPKLNKVDHNAKSLSSLSEPCVPVDAGVGSDVTGVPVGASVGSDVTGDPVGAGVGSDVAGESVGCDVGSDVAGAPVGDGALIDFALALIIHLTIFVSIRMLAILFKIKSTYYGLVRFRLKKYIS
jgi:hypothetical protein